MTKSNSVFLYGKNSIVERLKVDPGSVRSILVVENFKDEALLGLAKSANIPLKRVSDKELLKFKHSERIQGVAAEVDSFKYASLRELLGRPAEERLSFIFLDGVTDPQNLGAVIRTAACFGGLAVAIPEHESCEVNETVMNIASGGENYVPVCKVSNLSYALVQAKKDGYWIAGAVVENGEDLNKVSLPFPLCMVLGSEGKGIHYGVRKQLELKITLPMKGVALSFNVAMACAIFCYEISRQKNK